MRKTLKLLALALVTQAALSSVAHAQPSRPTPPTRPSPPAPPPGGGTPGNTITILCSVTSICTAG